MTHVLLVDIPAGLSLLRRTLEGYEFSESTTLESAIGLLERNDFSLIVVGVHFDDSRGLEFIRAAREHKNHKQTPLVIFRSLHSDIPKFLRSSIADISDIYNIASYIEADLYTSRRDLRRAIEAALPEEARRIPTRRRIRDRPNKVLLAASPAVRSIAERIIPDHHELCHAETLEEARLLLENETFCGIVCTVFFDRGHLFDLMRLVKSNKKWKDIRFICARCTGSLDAPIAIDSINSACKSYHGCLFVNIADYATDSNPELQMGMAIEHFLCPSGTV